ncbi:hypothetical protein VULLAG_LOCUS21027 [Vulpes lagopus]
MLKLHNGNVKGESSWKASKNAGMCSEIVCNADVSIAEDLARYQPWCLQPA